LSGAPHFESRAYREGLFHAQSEASQIVVRMLAPRAGAIVVDCAAAPGGKATHLAEVVGEHGRVIAVDLNFNGLKNARDLSRRMRHRNVEFVCADLTASVPLAQSSVEYVLLDAPCTGSGTLREHPEIKWRLKPTDSARMAAIQSQMLESAAALVRRGGAIVYSVCSISPEEGEGVVDGFLARHADFAIDDALAGRDEFRDIIDARGFMKTRPDVGGLDGFFAARLIRR
jgi:16S rRNA (cytosine967-C5)-methyltransferase